MAVNIVALAGPLTGLGYLAALVLFAFLPGVIWLQALFQFPRELDERLVLAVGLSLAFTILGVMAAAYWPGPLQIIHLLIISNIIAGAGLAVIGWRKKTYPLFSVPIKPFTWIILIALFGGAALLRLPRLGYAEFHEDEAEALRLGVRLLQGEDYALFLHRKGPAQMLLPVAFWLMEDRIDEGLARFPFALSSILSVLALFMIGRRWFGWQAGLLAGVLWGLNGYSIGFGRMVQYQALIFFLGPLAIYCFYLAWQARQARFQILGALFLAASLLAHFDALLLLPAAAYLGWVILIGQHEPAHSMETVTSSPGTFSGRLVTAGAVLVLFLGLLATFYLPYVLDPEFQNTSSYLSESRVKPGLLYNNLDLLRRFDRDYSSHFYLPVLALGLFGFVLRSSSLLEREGANGQEIFPAGKRFLPAITGVLLLLVVSTLGWPEWWQMGEVSLAILPWLGLGLICFWQAPNLETRVTWLMLGAPLIGYVFLVSDPRTHLYILYPGAVLAAGAGWIYWAGILRNKWLYPLARLSTPVLLVGGLGVAGILSVYFYSIFLQTESAFNRLRGRWDESAWEWVYDELPRPRDYFGYPKREGWKAIGALRAQGYFPGDFRSVNEDFIIPIWYTYGQPRSCYDTPAYFFVRMKDLDDSRFQAGVYRQVAEVTREGETRLQIYTAGEEEPGTTASYPLEGQIKAFDEAATPGRFTAQNQPAQPAPTRFGPDILFEGYDLMTPVVAPGETLYLNLYWQALDNPAQDYRAFVHLTDGATLWGQQDDTPACRLPTSIWRAGQHGIGQFRLLVNPNTPPGRYPLIIGLYQAETLERLTIAEGAGQIGDDFLWLGDVEVVDPAGAK